MDDQEKKIRLDYLNNMLWYLGTLNATLINEIKELIDKWDKDPQEELMYSKFLQAMENMNRFNTFYIEWKELSSSMQQDPSQP